MFFTGLQGRTRHGPAKRTIREARGTPRTVGAINQLDLCDSPTVLLRIVLDHEASQSIILALDAFYVFLCGRGPSADLT